MAPLLKRSTMLVQSSTSQRQGQQRDGGEAGIPAQRPQRVTRVRDHLLDHSDAMRFAHLLSNAVHSAERDRRLATRLGRAHAEALVLERLHLEVLAQLLRRLRSLARAEEQPAQTLAHPRKPPHSAPSDQVSTQFTAADERSHCDRSRASSRRPAAVSA
jgi:hypothetical protein